MAAPQHHPPGTLRPSVPSGASHATTQRTLRLVRICSASGHEVVEKNFALSTMPLMPEWELPLTIGWPEK